MTHPGSRSDENFHTILSFWFSKRSPAASCGEQAGQLAQPEKTLADRGYASILNRREMVTSAMHDGFAKAQRWEHEMSGPFPRTYDSAFTHLPWIAALMRCAFAGPDGKNVELDFRLTIGLRKIDGQRTVLHEHHSIPAAD